MIIITTEAIIKRANRITIVQAVIYAPGFCAWIVYAIASIVVNSIAVNSVESPLFGRSPRTKGGARRAGVC